MGDLTLWAIICYGGMNVYEDESVLLLSRVGALVVQEHHLLIIVCMRDKSEMYELGEIVLSLLLTTEIGPDPATFGQNVQLN